MLVLTLAFSMGHAVAAEDGEQASSYTRMLARKNQEFMSGDAVILGELPVQEAKDYTLMVYILH